MHNLFNELRWGLLRLSLSGFGDSMQSELDFVQLHRVKSNLAEVKREVGPSAFRLRCTSCSRLSQGLAHAAGLLVVCSVGCCYLVSFLQMSMRLLAPWFLYVSFQGTLLKQL